MKAIDDLTYPELPTHYRFDVEERVWVSFQKGAATVGRVLFTVGGRSFFLLLYNTKGPGSEAELFVVDGIRHET